jgi:hypothetical protein
MICSPEGPDEVRIREAAKDSIKQKWENSDCREKRLPGQIGFQMNPPCSYFRGQLILSTKYISTPEESLFCLHVIIIAVTDTYTR